MSSEELGLLQDADLFDMIRKNNQSDIAEQELKDRGYTSSEIKEELEG